MRDLMRKFSPEATIDEIEAVCDALDSDGDGLTNGDELGDPCCCWDAVKEWNVLLAVHDLPTSRSVLTSLRRAHPGRPQRAPDALAQQQVGLGELDRERDPPVHRLVEVHRPVGREDAQPLVPLELGEHGVHLQ